MKLLSWCLIALSTVVCTATVAIEARSTEYDAPTENLLVQAVDEAKVLGRIPLQPWHWGSHFDPLYTGEGVNLEVINNGPQANMMLVGYVYVYLDDEATTPTWAFANELVQPAFVSSPSDPHYRFNLYRTMPGGEPPHDPPGWLEMRTVPDGRLAVSMFWQVTPADDAGGDPATITRHWLMDQITRAPGVGDMVRCNPPGGFSPARPNHTFCVAWS